MTGAALARHRSPAAPRSRPRLPAPAALLALALAGGCALHDDPRPQPWVAIDAIAGPLQPELHNGVVASPPSAGFLRVVTYNVHLGRDLDTLGAGLRDDPILQDAHVFVFEEIESHPEDGASQAARLGALLGMNHLYAPAWAYADGATHGLALLARFPIVEARLMTLPYFDLVQQSERRIAFAATLDVGGRAVEVVGVHLDTRINVNQRLQQLEPAVLGAASSCILAGDFNSNPEIWFLRQVPMLPQDAAAPVDVPGAIDELMRYHGFATPTAGAGDTTNLGLVNVRLDSVYTRGFTPAGAGVVRSLTVSDHFPVWADVAWP